MTTPLTPPPAGMPQSPLAQSPAPQPPVRARWITPLLVIVGAVALAFTVVGGLFAGVRSLGNGDHTQSVTAQGMTELDVDVSAAEFTLLFDDVDEAVLDVRGKSGWTLERRDETLVVRPPVRWIFGWNFGEHETATLTLPERLRTAGLDADLDLSAGSLYAEGTFRSVDLEVNAGQARLEGLAEELDVDLNAGRADVLMSVGQADLSVNAGRLDADFSGRFVPSSITIDVSAGEMNVTVPDEAYAVTSDVSAGSFDNRLDVASDSPNIIRVDLSAGTVTLRPAQ